MNKDNIIYYIHRSYKGCMYLRIIITTNINKIELT